MDCVSTLVCPCSVSSKSGIEKSKVSLGNVIVFLHFFRGLIYKYLVDSS